MALDDFSEEKYVAGFERWAASCSGTATEFKVVYSMMKLASELEAFREAKSCCMFEPMYVL